MPFIQSKFQCDLLKIVVHPFPFNLWILNQFSPVLSSPVISESNFSVKEIFMSPTMVVLPSNVYANAFVNDTYDLENFQTIAATPPYGKLFCKSKIHQGVLSLQVHI
jgi:hypothetical protein